MTVTTNQHVNRVRNTFTLENSVDMTLKALIKPRERSEYINDLLKKDLQKKAMNNLNEKINNLQRINPPESPIEVLRKLRNNTKIDKSISNISECEQSSDQ